MNFMDFLSNYPLWCAALGWVVAQLMKTVVCMIQNKRFSFVSLVSSGGMPSSHSATVCALATAIAKTSGLQSPEFALSCIFAFIVMYDASGVRRAAGEQAKILNRMMESAAQGRTEEMPIHLKELIGHTPMQVFAGAGLGILLALVMNLLF